MPLDISGIFRFSIILFILNDVSERRYILSTQLILLLCKTLSALFFIFTSLSKPTATNFAPASGVPATRSNPSPGPAAQTSYNLMGLHAAGKETTPSVPGVAPYASNFAQPSVAHDYASLYGNATSTTVSRTLIDANQNFFLIKCHDNSYYRTRLSPRRLVMWFLITRLRLKLVFLP
jgi:hypothetical protein